MSLVPLIDDRSARIAARKRLRTLSSAVVDDGIDLRREPSPKIVAGGGDGRERTESESQLDWEPSVQDNADHEVDHADQRLSENALGRKQPAIRDILKAVAAAYNVSAWDIISQRRTNSVVPARQVTMYLARKLTLWSLPCIGRQLGGKDHTTVLHAIRRIEDRIPNDAALAARIAAIEGDLAKGIDGGRQPACRASFLPRDAVTVQQIIAAVSAYYGISESYFLSRSSQALPLLARRVAAYLTVEMTTLPNPEIRAAFDRSTSSYFPYNHHQPIKEKRRIGDLELEGDIAAVLDALRREAREGESQRRWGE